MNTLLADPPAVADPEQPSPETPGVAPPGAAPESPESTSAAPQRTCSNCGSPLDSAQDWCLQCGAGAPGSLDVGGPSWRSGATVLAATAILVLGAVAAAYAALSKAGHKAGPAIVTVAQTPPAAVTPTTPATPTPTAPGAVTPTPKAAETPSAANPLFPTGSTKPPKIPLTAPTPKSSGTTTTPSSTDESSPTTSTPSTGNESGAGKTKTTEQPPEALLLDTNAAATYNPYGYPASEFGDPSLAIDGDASTAWTAQVNPAVAPKLAEGLVIDLKTAQKVSALTLITSTPGITVQVYGANGHTLPGSITDPAWVALSPAQDVKQRKTHIKLHGPSTARSSKAKAFRFVALWISNAPASSVGTPEAPGHVSVNELELFPPTG